MRLWTGTSVRLRALEPADWQVLRRIAEDPDYVEQAGAGLPRPAAVYQHRASSEVAAQTSDDFTLAIVTNDSCEVVGTVSTSHAQPWNGTFAASIALDPDERGSGRATEAGVMLLRYMFLERRYQKCNVEVLPFNEPSLSSRSTPGKRRLRRAASMRL